MPHSWRPIARLVRSIVSEQYKPIDWQVDPTSRFRWSIADWSTSIHYGEQRGVEIKWPWELGRLQHLLPSLLMSGKHGSGHLEWSPAQVTLHLIDFMAANPPGFGVQWICPMDVGIRVANIALATDLLRDSCVSRDERLPSLVSASIRDHGRFLAGNLEWGDRLCSNHYLANIAGLLFAGAYLGPGAEADEWVAFAGRELVLQLRNQFHSEGSNFEASTCYHRLSAEMVVYSVALMLWIARERPQLACRWWEGSVRNFHPSPAAPPTPCVRSSGGIRHPFDEPLCRRISGMGAFTRSLLRADGSIPQIGDNDSGRFVRLQRTADPAADLLDHSHLCHAVDALFGRSLPESAAEARWIARWIGAARLDDPGSDPIGSAVAWSDFGLYVWRRGRIHATFRCGHVGQNGNGGHAHCDQLSITVAIDGVAFIDDPGTGVYTPDPDLRNRLRSSGVHSTLQRPGCEQGSWLPGRWGLFAMKDLVGAELLEFGDRCAAARMRLGGEEVKRRIEVDEDAMTIHDTGPEDLIARFTLVPEVEIQVLDTDRAVLRRGSVRIELRAKRVRLEEVPWSDRYGVLRVTRSIVAQAGDTTLRIL